VAKGNEGKNSRGNPGVIKGRPGKKKARRIFPGPAMKRETDKVKIQAGANPI